MPQTGSGSLVVMVSGANRGIGAAVAREMLQHGHSVSLGARDPDGLTATHGAETERRQHCRFDAFDKGSAGNWVDAAQQRFGRIDAVVNNAGSAEQITLFDDNEEAIDRLWEVNVKAPLRLTRLCIPHLEKSGRGRIVNIASLSGKRARNPYVGYNMTKFAVLGLTHTTRHAVWDKGIRATAVCPGFVKTDMTAGIAAVAPEDMIQPENLAELVRTVIELPNNAAVAELLVNCRHEDML